MGSSVNKTIYNVLMHPFKQEMEDYDDFSNLFRAELLLLFPDVQSIVLINQDGFPMSMSTLLSLICYSNWIKDAWQADKEILMKQYEESGFDIQYNEDRDEERDLMYNTCKKEYESGQGDIRVDEEMLKTLDEHRSRYVWQKFVITRL